MMYSKERLLELYKKQNELLKEVVALFLNGISNVNLAMKVDDEEIRTLLEAGTKIDEFCIPLILEGLKDFLVKNRERFISFSETVQQNGIITSVIVKVMDKNLMNLISEKQAAYNNIKDMLENLENEVSDNNG